MPKSAFLGEWEQLVMLAILRDEQQAYALSLRDHLSSVIGRTVGRGALYRTLDRLGEKGYIRWILEPPTPGRGGHPTRRFVVTKPGRAAVNASRRALQSLWKEVDEAAE